MKNLKGIFGVLALLTVLGASSFGMFEATTTYFALSTVSAGSVLATLPIWITVKGEESVFKELSNDEIEGLTDTELLTYTNAKYENLEGKLMKAIEKGSEQNKQEIEDTKEKMTNNLKDQLTILKNHDEMLSQINKGANKGGEEEGITVGQAVKNLIEENRGLIVKRKGDAETKLNISTKATVLTTAVSGNTMSARIPGVGQTPVRRTRITDLFAQAQVGPDSGGDIKFFDQATVTRNAATVAENTAVAESVITWIERTIPVRKIGDSIPVTEESLEDFGFIESEVNNLLLTNMDLTLEQQVLLGTGAGTQLIGIDSFAQTWVAGAFAILIQDPTIFDVISVGKTQIENSGQNSFFNPNVVLMHPTDIAFMKLSKDVDGNYLLPMFMTANGAQIDGMTVISTPLVVQNTLYIMDTTWGTIWNHRDLAISMATQHASDWTSDVVRLKATMRKAFVVRNLHQDAFLKVDSISAAVTALIKP